ncbi:uncharacterized protein KGF55_002035 [Candida pseudojiufengensis]|uniref:uncharacterized protein n=1 Tax=Candida pseudojiufengensis TaxID=497109 RepID=UPI0022246473|nr:uncharacterized protein KGF55_002035 [Candida pseudojiufengensis]KAI5964093.1 hypothetical protein KGF55_002035 [Candida pseudojiufengensis]
MFKQLTRLSPFRNVNRPVFLRNASSYIPQGSPILSSIPPLNLSSTIQPPTILSTSQFTPSSLGRLPQINTNDLSIPIQINVEIIGNEENSKDIDAVRFEVIGEDGEIIDNTIYTDSVLRKRRLKMKKHKHKKRRKAQRALRKRLGK